MKIVFMGGKPTGYGILEYLISNDQNIVCVFTNPGDTAASRWFPSVSELALEKGIPVFMPRKINSPESIENMKAFDPDLIIVAYYDQILKKEIFSIPSMGTINVHLALAEEYRGCYPTTWAIINGEKRTGVTIHYIDETIDGGDIIAQRVVDITHNDTGKSLYFKCIDAAVELFKSTWPSIKSGSNSRRPQDASDAKHYKREFPPHKVDFNRAGSEIYDYIRALTFQPFDPPYFYIGEKKMIIIEAEENDGLMDP